MRTHWTRRTPIAALAAACALAAGGCSSSSGSPRPSGPVVTLPPGELSTLVPQPGEVPEGLVPLLAQTGVADVRRISGFSANPDAAAALLRKHGFLFSYIAEYANPDTGQVLTVVVTRFTTATGARDDLAGDLAAKAPSGTTTLPLAQVGDQSGAQSQRLPGGPVGSQLITVRFRVGDTTWLVAVGARGQVDPESVRAIAATLATRANPGSPTSTPS